jgi:hypothetical protein
MKESPVGRGFASATATAAGSSTGTADAMARKDTLDAWRRRASPEKWEAAGEGYLARARREQSIGFGASTVARCSWSSSVRLIYFVRLIGVVLLCFPVRSCYGYIHERLQIPDTFGGYRAASRLVRYAQVSTSEEGPHWRGLAAQPQEIFLRT